MGERTLLVTGGAGFIGGNFVGLTVGDHEVVNLDALTYAGNLETVEEAFGRPDHIFIQGDIGDRNLVPKLLSQYRPRAVVNFAAETHVDRSIDGPEAFVETNVLATQRLLASCLEHWRSIEDPEEREAFRFLHVSTDEVYGALGQTGYFTEKSPYRPNSPYSASKAASDHFVRAYHHTYGLPTLTTNCSNNYGPYQFPEKLIPLVISAALAGKPLPVYGDGGQVRDWLYVGDHCRAILRVLEGGVPGEVYNVGGHNEKTNLETVRYICTLLDRLVPDSPHAPHANLIEFVTDRPGHDRRYAIDAGRMERDLGWTPDETFESGMEKTVLWYLENRWWSEAVMEGKYSGERLGTEETGLDSGE
ncbi:dTDP-glucose 4,6-dehydratase [Rubrobacter indicoceani]|uniref:dTDP-glucose 4,6-dehydratase n=1 Tax=Rubrobacter indicoceani TaxID=2051957 RepID=UPI000E5AD2B1|nr:dTDP-glucose 4,6-dehydratase [Rubrobacter indicoceani]